MSIPRISICMATKNGELFLRRQIDTILSQMLENDELIISDDASEDATLSIIQNYTDRRIRFLGSETFFGPIRNFEWTLAHASGDVVALSDQDDVWLPNKLSVIRELFRNVHARKLIILNGLVVDEREKVIHESIFNKINAGNGFIKNIYDNTYLGCCMAFSRDLLEIALPFPSKIPMHDIWLGNLAALFGTVEFVNEKTLLYRRHRATLTDFRIKFEPLQQIKRRFNLLSALAQRGLSVAVNRRKHDL